ncbi:MAG: 16S rRNA (guanine(527)-N(7))-methyltransferase RsmG [Rhodospirillaceae bacterium]|nr:16S rRNA (guanine(527)-N(7))-methyltransferase RsmG [Rhodospirillaceae bacterium]MDD9996838.1 16S rRNA (guanine(527)-N(7))-methyltransferase RsmG [Rhodospirillaceae bacterium]
MRDRLTERLAEVGLAVEPDAAEALSAFLGEMLRWNRVHNLTAITDPEAMIRRHAIESLALRPLLRGRRVADVGSGAGVPGIPLAIAEPDRHFTLIESRGKRAAFLRHVQGLLGLVNVAVEHCRVEEMNDAGTFDTLLARAVAAPAELLQLTTHLFGPASVMLVPTGEQADGEPLQADGRFELRRVEGTATKLIGGSLLIISRKRG